MVELRRGRGGRGMEDKDDSRKNGAMLCGSVCLETCHLKVTDQIAHSLGQNWIRGGVWGSPWGNS